MTVRVHWTTALVPLLFFAGFSRWPGFSVGEAAAWAVGWTFALYTVVWTHEMGHVWAARHLGVPVHSITLWPLGGLAHLSRPAPSARAEIFIALAGPLTHAFWFVAAGAPYLFLVHGTGAEGTAWAAMLLGFTGLQVSFLVFNLLPFWPMDGGAVTRGILAQRMHPNRASLYVAYVGFAGAAVLGLVGLAMMFQASDPASLVSHGGPLLLGIGISNFLACRMLLLQVRWTDGPYERADEAWKANPPQASWAPDEVPEPPPRDRAEERRERRLAEERKREAEKRRRLQERIDALLDRINEVGGVENLPESERRELAEASESLRRETADGAR